MKNVSYILLIGSIIIAAGFVIFGSGEDRSVYVVSMTADEMAESLKEGTIAGFIAWEPHPAKAVVNGDARYLVNSRESWKNHPSCVLAISPDLGDKDIMALEWVHVKATRFMNDPENREKVIQYGMEFSGLDSKKTSAAINNTLYIESPDLEQIKKGIRILEKAGTFKNSITSLGYENIDEFVSSVFTDEYYKEVNRELDEDPGWKPPAVNSSLRFGYIGGNIHYLTMYVAQKEGFFEEVGLVPGKNMQFVGYRSGRAITDAFKHREVDIANLGSNVLLRHWINDNGKIYAINGVNSGGSSLVVRADSDIDSLDDLIGRTIATPGFGTCQDVIMRDMFEGYEIRTK